MVQNKVCAERGRVSAYLFGDLVCEVREDGINLAGDSPHGGRRRQADNHRHQGIFHQVLAGLLAMEDRQDRPSLHPTRFHLFVLPLGAQRLDRRLLPSPMEIGTFSALIYQSFLES